MRIVSKEARLFLRKFMGSPKEIGSVIPSSRHLTGSMVRAVPWHNVRKVAELGAGTGVITEAIARNVSPDARVYVFEKDSGMRRKLRMDYPDFVHAANAVHLDRVLGSDGQSQGQLDCILSGLPFYNFPQAFRDSLLEQIVNGLKPGGLFVAFQYSLQMKKQLSKHFVIERIKLVPLNFPPAFVYICRKGNERDGK
ncbi:class I SAM-dependent methyltransferase [Cohnella lupini]|uniref:Phospholipid N-methyltransferase n=1 Tax=Cohnella lupini TaxID=1294267 RepID=A0A3D9I648_9BACL|nr:methyltransferase domain-containing protein [Cohnella lupini]RED57140.1 phospholipid N-methyltransferase [Cohnella lupini]